MEGSSTAEVESVGEHESTNLTSGPGVPYRITKVEGVSGRPKVQQMSPKCPKCQRLQSIRFLLTERKPALLQPQMLKWSLYPRQTLLLWLL